MENRGTNYLYRRINMSIQQITERVVRHYSISTPGASRLPVLSIHAALSIMARETDRYRNCTILPADVQTNLIGDVNVVDANGYLFEGYKIKHNTPITSDLIQTSCQKLVTTPAERFYILTTSPHGDYSEFEPDIQRVSQAHGRQLIVDSIDRTLLYYLRLIGNTRDFVDAYVTNLENDPSITFQLKEAWNEIVAT